jgi:hypothetical protein
VVLDRDRDGIVDERESGIKGWQMIAKPTVKSPCISEEELTVVTDAQGRFRFDGLVAGVTYSVYQSSSNRGPVQRWALYTPDARVVKSGDRAWLQPITVEVINDSTAEVSLFVIPLEGTASISGLFYYDSDRDGIRDPTDALVSTGAWIALGYRAPTGYVSVYQTDDMLSDNDPLPWRYEFSDLAPGDYVEGVIWTPGKPVNPPVGSSGFAERPVTLSRGQKASGLDFGFEPRQVAVPVLIPSPGDVGASPIGAPSTGTGGTPSTNTMPWIAAAIALAVIGSAGAGYALRRLRRGN